MNVLRSFLLSLFISFLTLSSISAQQSTYIHVGNLISVPGEAVQKEKTNIVKNGMITSIEDGFLEADDDVQLIDLKDKYVLPGLMDMHTHITGERDPNANPHEWTTLHDEDLAFRSIPYLRRTLEAGFTTIRNTGSNYTTINAIKRAINEGNIEGPRIIAAAGGVSATGGHGDFHGYRKEITKAFDDRMGICDGADDCSRAVRATVKNGADFIKITATGGVLSNTAAGVGQQFTDEELQAIVEAATMMGRKVAAHAHQADGINAALRAGVHSIEHGSYLDDESVRLFNETGAYLVPTILAGVSLLEEMEVNENIPPPILAKIKEVVPQVEAAFKRAVDGGVNIAFGTDSGVSKHGTNAREFELMVDYGMSSTEALRSATIYSAELLGMSERLGTLETGKIADIIAVDEDPVKNISTLKDVKFVMKQGKVYKDQ